MPDPAELDLPDILALREEGRLQAEVEGKRYALLLYELYPNGTSSNCFVQEPHIVSAVGDMTGLGPPTDPLGWGVWVVDEILQRKETE